MCAAIAEAVAKAAPGIRYAVEVRVLSRSRLAATLEVDGRPLPEQRFATMDRELNAVAFQDFARSLAAEMAKVRKA